MKTKGGYYNGYSFNEHRLTSFHQWQIDGIKQSDPEGLLAGCLVLFPQLERKVRILYSEPSAIHDPNVYPLQVRDASEALYFHDYPAGFITGRMICEG